MKGVVDYACDYPDYAASMCPEDMALMLPSGSADLYLNALLCLDACMLLLQTVPLNKVRACSSQECFLLMCVRPQDFGHAKAAFIKLCKYNRDALYPDAPDWTPEYPGYPDHPPP
eukprot:scaffold15732_cov19-Tisochrysis_lutea.AAC.4